MGALEFKITPRAPFLFRKLVVLELWRTSWRFGARVDSPGIVWTMNIDALGTLAGFWAPCGSVLGMFGILRRSTKGVPHASPRCSVQKSTDNNMSKTRPVHRRSESIAARAYDNMDDLGADCPVPFWVRGCFSNNKHEHSVDGSF